MKKLKTTSRDAEKKWSSHKVCGVIPEAGRKSMVGKICERGRFEPRMKERGSDESGELTE